MSTTCQPGKHRKALSRNCLEVSNLPRELIGLPNVYQGYLSPVKQGILLWFCFILELFAACKGRCTVDFADFLSKKPGKSSKTLET